MYNVINWTFLFLWIFDFTDTSLTSTETWLEQNKWSLNFSKPKKKAKSINLFIHTKYLPQNIIRHVLPFFVIINYSHAILKWLFYDYKIQFLIILEILIVICKLSAKLCNLKILNHDPFSIINYSRPKKCRRSS